MDKVSDLAFDNRANPSRGCYGTTALLLVKQL